MRIQPGSRRTLLLLGAAALLLPLASLRSARADYLDDGRTARGATLTCPRVPLSACLRALSEATGIALTAAPGLADEPLVGYVPQRPVREMMDALAELFDGTWTVLPGTPAAYRLDPQPDLLRTRAAARKALLADVQKSLDAQAAVAVKNVRSITMNDGDPDRTLFPKLVWALVPPADRERALAGESITLPVPESQTGPLRRLTSPAPGKAPAKFDSMLLSVELDVETDANRATPDGLPKLHTRVTEKGPRVISGSISLWDIGAARARKATGKSEPAPDSPLFPRLPAGEGSRIYGNRDELVLKLATAARIPVLARVRPIGMPVGIDAEGRKLSEVVADLATLCDANVTATARGFRLLRSTTELLDPAYRVPLAPLESYLKTRPPVGSPVRLAVLSGLAAFTPLQLAQLQLLSACQEDAREGRKIYAILRFYRGLTAAQQKALFSPEGLDVAELTHPQWHLLVDEAAGRRADWMLREYYDDLPGLRFFFAERVADGGLVLDMRAQRGDSTSRKVFPLPVVRAEAVPTASR